ncbi:MAG: L-histidine N(alpha)-methyltransferase [Gemmatimonadetes bacterium]|nr:L-histidine N(alpha)-methyltransferase [Gemmatimonadota bacterium]
MTMPQLTWRRALDPQRSAMAREVLAGLRATPKVVSPKYFYDDVGARLFEAITQLPEYYPTRTELEILRTHATDIAGAIGPAATLVEFGSGAAVKVKLLLDALERPTAYVPIDISSEQLVRVALERRREYPALAVQPVCADYTSRVTLPSLEAGSRRVAFFPGSTIGNFHPAEATAFLSRVRDMVGPTGAMVLGVDRRKDPRVLHDAYNDAAGVTAEFNLNVLARLNRELDGIFDLDGFAHRAFFNDGHSRIEMHLESLYDQVAWVAGTSVAFARGETIHTENSYKYDAARLAALVEPAGFQVTRTWTDPNDWFWVVLLDPTPCTR